MKFRVEGKPVPQGSMKVINGHVLHAQGSALIYWRSAIAIECKKVIPVPLTGAVEVRMAFELEKPKSVNRTYPAKYPDLDKLIRAVLDGITGSGVVDDGQVINIVASKRYGRPSVTVEIISAEEMDDSKKIF
jgi:Holliday junction resolvase RusA-like endonuclease